MPMRELHYWLEGHRRLIKDEERYAAKLLSGKKR